LRYHEVKVEFEFYTDYNQGFGNIWQCWLQLDRIAEAKRGSLEVVPAEILRKLARKSLLQNVLSGLEGLASGDLNYAKDVLDRNYGEVTIQGRNGSGYITWDNAKQVSLPALHPQDVVTFHEDKFPWKSPGKHRHSSYADDAPTTPPRKRRPEIIQDTP
jgi:hypothetical protein